MAGSKGSRASDFRIQLEGSARKENSSDDADDP
jgi:hypothetical protein